VQVYWRQRHLALLLVYCAALRIHVLELLVNVTMSEDCASVPVLSVASCPRDSGLRSHVLEIMKYVTMSDDCVSVSVL